jgi:transcriptional regulator
MYIPKLNVEDRLATMHAFMGAHPLAALVTLGSTGLFATHLPLLLEQDGSEFGVLRGHVARANAQWRDFTPTVDALAIFTGPDHYITPNWYPGKREHGKEVPTWNYAVVHAYGPLRAIDDREWLRQLVTRLTDHHEAASPVPWKVADAPAEFIDAMLKAIVGVEIPIRRLEGKWKASQNRNAEDREGVLEGLDELGTPRSLAMKQLVQESNQPK